MKSYSFHLFSLVILTIVGLLATNYLTQDSPPAETSLSPHPQSNQRSSNSTSSHPANTVIPDSNSSSPDSSPSVKSSQATNNLHSLSSPEQKSLWKAFSEARREVRPIPEAWSERPENTGYDFYALHPKQALSARFGSQGTQFVSSNRTYNEERDAQAWEARMRLISFAGEAAPNSCPPRKSDLSTTKLEYRHSDNLTEWFDNGVKGVEHGYTIASRPANLEGGEEISIEVELEGLNASIRSNREDDRSLVFAQNEQVILSYSKLLVVDANGKHLPSSMKPTKNGFSISYDDSSASYPVTVDPLILNETEKFVPESSGADSLFGSAIAINGYHEPTAVIGAPGDSAAGDGTGSVYIFTSPFPDTWLLQDKLTASDAAVGDAFGSSVSIFGNTVIVGAPGNDDSGSNSGSAYVFFRIDTSWNEEAKLTASDATAEALFGNSVSISTGTILVGAKSDTNNGNTSGAAYIFSFSDSTWSQQAKLIPDNPADGDCFGISVAVEQDTAVIGATGDDDGVGNSGLAYVFTRTDDSWSLQTKLTASDAAPGDQFGCSVSFSGSTVVIGAYQDDDDGNNSGSAYIFSRANSIWSETTKLVAPDAAAEDQFGWSVSISGELIIVGANQDDANDDGVRTGSAYIFYQHFETGWTQETKLSPSHGEEGDQWGWSVAIDNNQAIIGMPFDNDHESNTGSAYAYLRYTSNWFPFESQWFFQDKLSDSSVGDNFGGAVAISGDTVIVGVSGDQDSGFNSGSAYIFARTNNTWQQQAKILASDSASEDRFGEDVAISGDYVVVGAYGNENDSGSAYVFSRSGTTWSEQEKLRASDAEDYDYFGNSVSISGDSIVVGSNGDQDHGQYSGSAYIFVRSGNTWTEQAKLNPSDAMSSDNFGASVSISGDFVVIGASGRDEIGINSGTAYIFFRTGTNWSQQAKLTPTDVASGDGFGSSVAISMNTTVIAAPGDDDNGSNSGSAYVFTRSNTTWTQQAKLTATDGSASDNFGQSTSIFENSILIGSPHDDDSGFSSGSAYLFKRYGESWSQQAKLNPSDASTYDNFGWSVSLSNNTAVVGALGDDDIGSNSGSAYIFKPPGILVFGPTESPLVNGESLVSYPTLLLHTSEPLTFGILNTGDLDLDIQSVALDGLDADQFSIALPDISSTTDLAPNEILNYSITFSPSGPTSGARNATVTININDSASPVFTFDLSGLGLSKMLDGDNDGMNDWGEFALNRYGFDWQVSQTEQVNQYYDLARTAGLVPESQIVPTTESDVLINVNTSSSSVDLVFTFQESSDLESFSEHNVDPAKVSVDGNGNIRYEFDTSAQTKFFQTGLKP